MRMEERVRLWVLCAALGFGMPIACTSNDDSIAETDTDDTDTDDTDDTDTEDTDTDVETFPTVSEEAVYTPAKTEGVTYAQGLVDANWGREAGTVLDLKLDLWQPEGAEETPRPALVLIHGGGFTGGSRQNAAIVRLCEYFAERGWVTASISYRLAGTEGTIPAAWNLAASDTSSPNQVRAMYLAARDARAAVRWMSANAETYNIDPNHIAVGGGSAGAFTAIAVGVSKAGDFLDELTDEQDQTLGSTNPTASSKVRAILDYWGGPTIPQVAGLIDGASRFDATDPPISIFHGTADETVPYGQATALVDLYTETGATYELYPLEGKGHGPWGARYEGQTLAELSFAFLVNQQGLVVE